MVRALLQRRELSAELNGMDDILTVDNGVENSVGTVSGEKKTKCTEQEKFCVKHTVFC